MINREPLPVTPEWSLPPREVVEVLTIPPLVVLGEN